MFNKKSLTRKMLLIISYVIILVVWFLYLGLYTITGFSTMGSGENINIPNLTIFLPITLSFLPIALWSFLGLTKLFSEDLSGIIFIFYFFLIYPVLLLFLFLKFISFIKTHVRIEKVKEKKKK